MNQYPSPSKRSGYFWSACINGTIATLFLLISWAGTFINLFLNNPIPDELILGLIRASLGTTVICGPIAVLHYRKHLLTLGGIETKIDW